MPVPRARGWFESRMATFFCVPFSFSFFVGAMFFPTSVRICMMIEVSSEQSGSQFYMHTECCCRCCCCCCCSVLLYCYCCCRSSAAASCCCSSSCAGRSKFVAGSSSLMPVFSFHSNAIFFFDVPLLSALYCVAFTASIYLHPR